MKRNKGFTFAEIMLAIFICAMSLLPIYNMFAKSTGMTKEERAQAAAASYAAKVLNTYLFEISWDGVQTSNIKDGGFLDDNVKSDVEFRWSGKVMDAWPVGTDMAVKRTQYHSGCGGPCTAGIEDVPRRSPQAINQSFVTRVGGVVFKTILVVFKWKGPGDTDFIDAHTQVLVGRRAMLDEANK